MLARLGMAAALVLGFLNTSSNGNTDTTQSSGYDSAVRFRLRDNYKVIVPVSVSGLEPMGFILDTGTKTTMIDECVCGKLELKPVARMPLTTFTGTRIVTISRIDSLSMGKASVQGLEVTCVDLRGTFSVGSDIRGVLGQDFLARFNYLLDYRRQRIWIEEGGDLQGDHLPLELREYRDHVHCGPASSPQQEIHFMLDSGAPFAVVFEDSRVCATLQVQRDDGRADFSSAYGSRSVEPARISILRVGTESLGNLPVRLTRARENERRWENGLLPTRLFQAIYFNHEAGYVILNPRPSASASLNR